MLAILQFWIKAVLTLGVILGLIFMIVCTSLVIVCAIHGDIKISITRSKAENEKK